MKRAGILVAALVLNWMLLISSALLVVALVTKDDIVLWLILPGVLACIFFAGILINRVLLDYYRHPEVSFE